MAKWYQLQGAENDVVISTKVAIARNVKGYNFTVRLTDDEKYEIADKIDEILDIVKGPDFPTGGIVQGKDAIKEVFATGKGKVVLRSKCEIVEGKNNNSIVVSDKQSANI